MQKTLATKGKNQPNKAMTPICSCLNSWKTNKTTELIIRYLD